VSNAITEGFDKINQLITDERKMNDERYDALEKNDEARAKDLDLQLDRIGTDIVEAQKQYKEDGRKAALLAERVDILEAMNDRPGKTQSEKFHDEHKEAFIDAMRGAFRNNRLNGKVDDLVTKAGDVKDVNIGTNADGGFAVPEEISRNIGKLMLRMSDVLNEINFVQVGTSDYKELITINGTTTAWVAETGSRTAKSEPTLRQITPTWGELYTYLKASEWSLDDIFFNVQSWLEENAAEQMAKAVDLSIWSGDGSSKPTGMTNSAPVSTADTASPIRAAAAYQYVPTNQASPQAVNADDIIDLVYTLNRAYRGNAKFGCNTTTQGVMRKLKSSNGDYYWNPSFQSNQPDLLLGYPVFTFEDMADPTTADGLYLGFGDWRKAYTLTYRAELRVTVDANITTPGFYNFYVRRRFGGIVRNNDALKLLKLADS